MGFLNPIFILSILIALTVHEWAHAFVANRLGDPTAREMGRLTLNPIVHLDPMGTILFLLVGFGWGKPVPVNERYFHHPKRDTALVAAAGPVSNLVLAFIAFIALSLLGLSVEGDSILSFLFQPSGENTLTTFFTQFFLSSVFVNLGLMAFNLLPIAPLDGSKVLHMFIPLRYENTYEDLMRWGPYILLFLLIAERFVHVSILSAWIETIMMFVLTVFTTIAGVIPGL